MRRRFTIALLLVAGLALLAGTAGSIASSRHAEASTYKVGIVYSRTGLLAAYGAEYMQGLKLGLKYATKGTNQVNGKTINLMVEDDKTDPATGVADAKDLLGQGVKILMGPESSGVSLQVAFLAAQNQVLY